MHRLTLLTLIAVLLGLAGPAALADDRKFEFEEITAEDWAVQEDEGRKIFDAAVIFEKWIADETEHQRKCTYWLYRRIRVLRESGKDWADVEVPILELDQKIKELEGRTVLPDGSIIPLVDDQVHEHTVIKTRGEKVKQYRFSLPGVTDDCILEYILKIETENEQPLWAVQKSIPVLYGKKIWYYGGVQLHISAFLHSQAKDIVELIEKLIEKSSPNYLWLNCGAGVQTTLMPSAERPEYVVLEVFNLGPFREEVHSLPPTYLKARNVTYYATTDPPISFWSELSQELLDVLNTYKKKDKRLKKKVSRLSVLPAVPQRIDAAYSYVQDSLINVSYHDLIEHEGTPKETKKEPKVHESIDETLKDGYGSNIELNILFWALLQELNVNAKFAFFVDRRENILVTQAKYWQFDRTAIIVPRATTGFDIYVPGDPFVPAGVAPWFAEGTDMLILDGQEVFEMAPFSASELSATDCTYDLEISEDGEVFGHLTELSFGHDAYRYRYSLHDKEGADRLAELKETVTSSLNGAELDSIACRGLDSHRDTLTITAELAYPEIDLLTNRVLLKPFDYAHNLDNPFTAGSREFAIMFDYASSLTERLHFTLPGDWQVEALPADTMFSNQIGFCKMSFAADGDRLSVTRTFTLNHPFWMQEAYPQVQQLFSTRQHFQNTVVVLTESPSLGAGE